MRILRGLEEAKHHIASRGNIESDAVPEAVAKGIEDIFGRAMSPAEVVTYILEEVRLRGDAAVKELSRRIDGVDYDNLEVDREDMERAYDSLPEELRDAMGTASRRIASFAKASLPKSWYDETTGLGETMAPLERVGVYIPGGTAAYPSTVLMTVVTARSAGVDEIVMCTPVRGAQSDVVLAAAYAAGVDRVFRIGGAQAIAAMAYGTESVPAVHKICGPGNIFVTLAKKLVFGAVGIDGIFGPTETMIIADEHADPRICAADLIGQAEHDVMASPAMATDSEALAGKVTAEMEQQMETLERREIARGAVDGQGVIFIVDNLDQAVEIANLFAPEHLTLLVKDPWALKPKVRHAGALFLGRHSGEVLGDYIAGPSHTIPTHGTARFASYLGSDQFVKRFPVVSLNESDADDLIKPAAVLARAEGLTAHARAVELRKEQRDLSSQMNDSTDITKLMLSQVREALPYAGVDPPEVLAQRSGISEDRIVKLNGNENLYGASPKVARALAAYNAYNIYPDPRQGRLREVLAGYTGSEPERIVAGVGSDEIIDLLLRLFVGPGDQVIRFTPGFEMYSTFTHLVGGRMVSIPLDETFDVDIEKARQAADHVDAKVLFLTSPNNPTGNLFSEDTVRSLLQSNILVVVDEAYYEFSKTTMAHLLSEYPNLVVLRTFSKWAGLAGLRLGYGIMSPEVAERMLVIKPPYNVSIAAEIGLYASLEDKDLLLSRVDEIVRQRDALFRRLQGMTGLAPVPSHANFILCRIQGGNGMYVYEELAKRGIFVRYYNNPQLQDYVRISVGLPEHNQALVEALQDILS